MSESKKASESENHIDSQNFTTWEDMILKKLEASRLQLRIASKLFDKIEEAVKDKKR
ncbi:MAG: hypothetical protein AAF063_17535 [Cyanobacteria bacterium J06643_5]